MECSEALDLLYSSFDGQITPTQQSLLDGHRRTCFACASSMIKAERFQELIRHVPQLTVPRGLEQRIISRVVHGSSSSTPSDKVRSITTAARQNWRQASAFGGVLAAALAVGVYVHNASLPVSGPPLVAAVQGALETIDNGATTNVANGTMDITGGSTVANTSINPAVVALTAHLNMTLQGGSQVHFERVATDPKTGNINEIDVHVDRGGVQVHEDLHHEASPIKIATDQATVVPTGTTFSVDQRLTGTHVTVNKGSVAVYTAGRVMNLLAGQGMMIAANGGVLRDKPVKPATTTPTKDIVTKQHS
ncbi:MAG TPA: FecR domain-containing protein [Candidatus Eremiobacteraceae bacterium]|nr:FecR domain-containing protein [Candidatus Eremiobacteraceae bacterium]